MAESSDLLAEMKKDVADTQVVLKKRLGYVEDAQRKMSDRLEGMSAQLVRIEQALAIIREYLVTKMRADGPAPDADDLYHAAIALGLTPAESDVASMLSRGMVPEAVAEARGCQIATVRTQIRRSCKRLGVLRQMDLVRLVLLQAAKAREGIRRE